MAPCGAAAGGHAESYVLKPPYACRMERLKGEYPAGRTDGGDSGNA